MVILVAWKVVLTRTWKKPGFSGYQIRFGIVIDDAMGSGDRFSASITYKQRAVFMDKMVQEHGPGTPGESISLSISP